MRGRTLFEAVIDAGPIAAMAFLLFILFIIVPIGFGVYCWIKKDMRIWRIVTGILWAVTGVGLLCLTVRKHMIVSGVSSSGLYAGEYAIVGEMSNVVFAYLTAILYIVVAIVSYISIKKESMVLEIVLICTSIFAWSFLFYIIPNAIMTIRRIIEIRKNKLAEEQ